MSTTYPADNGAPLPPPQQSQAKVAKKPVWKRWWFWLIAIIIIAFVTFLGSALYEASKINQLDAKVEEQCREKVIEQAKYPGGVQFVDEPVVKEEGITVNDRGNDVLSMGGKVDFPNAFGTPTRGTYVCLSEVDGYEILQTKAIVSGFKK
ncbi:hypothetical protein [Corynebacterium lujinxingii]|uniref:Uncharacterized protein n=1 Tax=Corynebacterium lujinxingii TaxID=2763010 RepID=A0A7H0K0N7_9CORY|nr:hypothetical protein [Corynebacterium lujinxingii]MBC3179403.1 hypothetical protein [Corynebacterium lujinxingii]NNO11508.1 hypothetical protein [Corynebacterium lujinxingii]QNP90853.1 hypothetical protein IAU68_03560 [Corynebacterium lujinxingii]